jgi:hypothetical protein
MPEVVAVRPGQRPLVASLVEAAFAGSSRALTGWALAGPRSGREAFVPNGHSHRPMMVTRGCSYSRIEWRRPIR